MKQIIDNLKKRLRSLARAPSKADEILVEQESARSADQHTGATKRTELDQTPSRMPLTTQPVLVRQPTNVRTRKATLSKPRQNPLSVNTGTIWGSGPAAGSAPSNDPFGFDAQAPAPPGLTGTILPAAAPAQESQPRSSRSAFGHGPVVSIFGTPQAAEPAAQPASFLDPLPPFGGGGYGGDSGDRMF